MGFSNRYWQTTTCLTAVLLVMGAPGVALANPVGGTVSAGGAVISSSGNKTSITQTSDRAVIDWHGFDIGAGETTQFYQPSSSSVTLNRVGGSGPSVIDGQLLANGNIFIINPNGVLFGAHSHVDVNGLVASTADVSNANFMAGKFILDIAGNPNASVINRGTITARQAGLVGLVAPNVVNSGIITARLGRVHLASGDTATVDLYGDGLLEVAVSDKVKSQLVSNTGIISADGGTIALTAAAGRTVVNSVVTVSGELSAMSVGSRNGRIIIAAEGSNAVSNNIAANKGKKTGSSTVTIAGLLDVSGKGTGETGGSISITGDALTVKAGSLLDASGANGGGTILIGGDEHGAGTLGASLTTVLEQGATITADALVNGNGGKVILWSDGRTEFAGSISAKGGVFGGLGGFTETSGHDQLKVTGTVNLTSADGNAGTWLLDPTDITIYGSAHAAGDGTNTFNTTQLQTMSTSANISLMATNNITLDMAGTTLNITTAGRSVTLQANNKILTASAGTITTNNGAISLTGNVGILFNQAFNLNSGGGAISLNNATTLGANLGINAGAGTVTFASTVNGAFNLTGAAGSFVFGDTVGGTTALNAVSLTSVNGFTLPAMTATTISASTTGAAADLTIGGALTTSGSGAALTLAAGHDLIDAGPSLSASNAAGNILLKSGNSILVSAGADIASNGGSITLNSDSDGSLAGAIQLGSGTALTSNGGAITLGGGTAGTGAANAYGTAANAQGIDLNGATLDATGTVTGGVISLRGQGFATGSGTGQSGQMGIKLENNAVVKTNNAGTIALTGVGAGAAGASGMGIDLINGASITSAAGNITLSGTGFGLSGGDGIYLSSTGTNLVSATGNGGITATGIGGTGAGSTSSGITSNSATGGFTTGGSGALSLTGTSTAGTASDLVMGGGTIGGGSSSGAILLKGDSLNYSGGTIQTTGGVTITTRSASGTVGVNGSTGVLQVTSSVLGNISAASVTLGAATNTGLLRMTGLDLSARNYNLSLLGGSGGIQWDGGGLTMAADKSFSENATGGNFLMTASGGAFASSGSGGFTFSNAINLLGNVSVTAGSTGTLAFGSTINGGFDLSVTGSPVTFGGAIGGTTALGNVTINTNNSITLPAITTIAGRSVNVTGHVAGNTITTTGTIATGTGGSITLIADDVILGGNLSGTGTLTIAPTSASRNICINNVTGTCSSANLGLSTAELADFVNGWGTIVIGRSDATGSTNIGASSWVDPITFLGDTSVKNITGAVAGTGDASFTFGTATKTGSIVLSSATITTVGQAVNFYGNVDATSSSVSTAGGLISIQNQTTMNATGTGFSLNSGNGTITFGDKISGGAAAETLSVTAGTGSIAFGGTIDGPYNLTASGNGLTFGGVLGGTTAMGNVTLTSLNSLTLPAITTVAGKTVGATVTGAGNTITTSGAITTGSGGNITLTADDLILGSNSLSGTGTITLRPNSNSQTVCVNYSCTGSYLGLSTAELGDLQEGWSSIVIGKSTGTFVFLGSTSWSDPLTVYNAKSILSGMTGTDNASLTFLGTGAIDTGGTFTTANQAINFQNITSYGTTINTNGGALNFAGNIFLYGGAIAANTAGGAISVGTLSSTAGLYPLSFNAGSGNVSFTSAVSIGDDFTVTGNAISFNGAWTGVGNVTLNAVSSLTLPAITTTAGKTVSATVSGAGNSITTSGIATGAGGNITLIADDATIGGALSGTGIITLQPYSSGRAMDINTVGSGDFNLTTAEIANLTDGWSMINLGQNSGTGAITIGTSSWTDALTIRDGGSVTLTGNLTTSDTLTTSGTGSFNVQGALALTGSGKTATFGTLVNAAGGTITTNNGNVNFNANLSGIGTGTLTVNSTGGTINVSQITNAGSPTAGAALTFSAGTGTVAFGGTVNGLFDITGTANNFTFGGAWGGTTGLGNVALTSVAALTTPGMTTAAGKTVTATVTGAGNKLTTGAINTGTGGNITLIADDLDMTGAITGTGTLSLRPQNATRAININSGTDNGTSFYLSTADIGNITAGWGSITIGNGGYGGGINLGAVTWTSNLSVLEGSGAINILGAQTMGSNSFSASAGGTLGSLNFNNGSITTSATGAAITLNSGGAITTTGTNSISASVGTVSATSVGNMALAPVTAKGLTATATGAGSKITASSITINSAGNATLTADDMDLLGTVSGTGTLTLKPNDPTRTINIGTGPADGTDFNLSTADIGNIAAGWAHVVIGGGALNSAVNLGNVTWLNPFSLVTNNGDINIVGAQAMGANSFSAQTTGTGKINFNNGSITTSVNGVAVTLNSNTTITTTGTNSINALNGFVSVTSVGNMSLAAVTATALTATATGAGSKITTGSVTAGTGAVNFVADDLDFGGSITGSGALTMQTSGGNRNINVNNGSDNGTSLYLSTADIGDIGSGWSLVTVGTGAWAGVLSAGAMTWNDPLKLLAGGTINILGAQTMGSNSFNATLTGTGGITFNNGSITTSATGNAVTLSGAGNDTLNNLGTSSITASAGSVVANFGGVISLAPVTAAGTVTATGSQVTLGAINASGVTATATLAAGRVTAGTIAVGTGNITLIGDDITVGGALSGSGTLTIQAETATRSYNIFNAGDTTGYLTLSNTEIANFTNGWGHIVIGASNGTGSWLIGAQGTTTWSDPTKFLSQNGNMTFTNLLNGTDDTSFTFTTTGNIVQGGAITTQGGSITYGGNLFARGGVLTTNGGAVSINAIGNDTSATGLTVTTNGGAIDINSTISGTTSNAGKLLTFNAAGGDVTFHNTVTGGFDYNVTGNNINFGGAWGTGTNLGTGTLTFNAANSITLPQLTTIAGKNVNATVSGAGKTITVNGIINTGTNGNITLKADDIAVNATLTGFGTTGLLTLLPYDTTRTINVNTGPADGSDFNISTADIAHLGTGWGSIVIGSTLQDGAINLGAATWSSSAVLNTRNSDININGAENTGAAWFYAQTFGTGNINFNNGGSVTTTAAISGSSPQVYLNSANGITATGTNSISAVNGLVSINAVNDIQLPTSISSNGLKVIATGSGKKISTGTGTITESTAGSSMLLQSDDVAINGSIVGNTSGNFFLLPYDTSRVIDVNYGPADGTDFNLSTAELARMGSGWGSIQLGTSTLPGSTMNGGMNIGNSTWLSPTGFAQNNGDINFLGTVDYGAKNMSAYTYGTGKINLVNATITSTNAGANAINFNSATTIVGTGTNSITDANSNGLFNSVGDLLLPTLNLKGATIVSGGKVTTSSAATAIASGTGNFSITANDVSILGDMTGSGVLTFTTGNSSTRAIDIATGANDGTDFNIDTTELGHILAGSWSNVTFGSGTTSSNIVMAGTQAFGGKLVTMLTAGGNIDLSSATLTSGGFTAIASGAGKKITTGAITVGTGNINLTADNMDIQGDLSGTGNIVLTTGDGSTRAINVNNSAADDGSNLNISAAELAHLVTGWTNTFIGSAGTNSTINIGATSWTSTLTLFSNNGDLNIGGLQNMGTSTFTGRTYGTGNINFLANGGITTASTNTPAILLVSGGAINTTSGNSLTATNGTIAVSSVGNMSLAAVTSKGLTATATGATSRITTAGATVGTGNITFTADDLTINGNLSGSGTITIQPQTGTRAVNVIRGADDGSSLYLSAAEIAKITNGWSSIVLGNSTMTGVIGFGGATSWSDPLTINTAGAFLGYANMTGTDNASFTLNAGSMDLRNMTMSTLGQAITLNTSGALFASTINTNGGSFTITGSLNFNISTPETDAINTAGGDINLNGAITGLGGQVLNLNAGVGAVNFGSTLDGAFDLTATAGTITTAADIGATTGLNSLSFTSTNAMTLRSIRAGTIFARTTGTTSDITLASGTLLTATNSGNALTLASGRNFINNASATPFTMSGGGRWLVYSNSPLGNTGTTITPDFNRYSCTYSSVGNCSGGTVTIPGTGNGFAYVITPILTVTPNQTVTYGDAATLNGYSYSLTGYLGGDTDTVTGSLLGSSTYAQGNNVGSYNINYVSGALTSALGYSFNYVNSTTGLTVVKRVLTATLTGVAAKVYDATIGATLDASNYNLGNIYNGDDIHLTIATSGNYDDKNVGTGKTVTVTGLSLTGSQLANYSLGSSTVSGTIGTVTKKAITVSATGVDKTYDGTTTGTVTLSDSRIAGDILTDSYSTASYLDKNAGTNKTLNVSGISLSGTDAGNYSYNTTATTTANIGQRALTVGATGISKTYDGTTTGTVTLNDDRIAGDILSDSYSTATYGDKNAGTGKTMSISGISVTGTDAANYTFNTTATTNTGAISQKVLTVGATGVSKTYDGTTTGTVTLSDNRIAGDILSDSYSTATYGDKNAGTGKTMSVSGISVTGTDAGNYTYNTTATTNTGAISQRALTVSATGVGKTYDGTTTGTVTLGDDRIAGDILSDSYSTASYLDKNAGTNKTLNVSGINVTGTDAGNYTFNTTASTTATIGQRALTVSATGTDKTYDGTTAGTATLNDNRVAGDILSESYTATYGDKNVGVGKTLSISGISLSGADANNYTYNTTAATTATITKRALTVSATGTDKTYDGTTAGVVTLSDNRIAGDLLSDSYTSADFVDKNAGTSKTINVSGIGISGTDAGNYSFNTTAVANANIGQRALTVGATGVSKTYDGTTTGTVTLSDNRVAGDILSDSYSAASYLDKNAGTGKTMNVSGISLSGTDAGNYTYNTTATTTGAITQRALTVSATDNGKVYDGTTTGTVTLGDNRIAGDILSDSYSTATYGDKNAGTGKTMSISGISVTGADAANYTFNTTATTNTGAISKKALTVSATGTDKTYDGTTTGTVTLGDNRIAGDILTDSYSAASYLDKNAGTNKTLNVSGISLSGTDANNYSYNTTATTTATIGQRALTVGATDNGKVYDGTTTGTVTLGDNRIAGDILSDSYSTATYGDKNAGTGKTMSISGISVTGTDAANYTFNTTATTNTGAISKKALTVSATDNGKVYDGTTTGTVTLGDNRIAGDILSDSYSTATYGDKNAGTGKTMSISGISVTGTDANNYTFNTTATTTTGAISQKVLTVSATGVGKTYDGTTTGTVTLSDNRIAGDILSDSYSAASYLDKNAGTGKTLNVSGISLSGTDANNYSYNTTATTTATIGQRALTVGATDNGKVYDGTTTGTVTLGDNRIAGDILSDSYSSATYGDKNAGTGKTMSISGISISGTDANNYTFNTTATTNTGAISKKALTVSATGTDKTYDGTTTGTVTLSDNRIAGDILSDSYSTATYGDKNAGTNKALNVSGINVTGTDAGNYSFNTTATTTANIGQRALTVGATGVGKTYDGTTTGTVTLSDNRIAGDILSDSYSTATYGDKNAGTGKTMSISGISVTGTDAANYTYNTTASTTATIGQRALTVSATGTTKTYDGTTAGAATLSDNRVVGDILSDSYSTAVFTNKNAGTGRTMNVGGISISGTDAANYTYNTTTSTTATITPMTVTVTANSGQSKTYGDADSITYGYSALASGDTASGVFSGLLGRDSGQNVGSYQINQGTLTTNGNYTVALNPTPVYYSITPRDLTVTATDKTKTYGAADPTLTYTSGTLYNGDTAASVFTGTLSRDTGENVSPPGYAINQGTLSAGSNYTIHYTGGTLTIIAAALDLNVIANAQSKTIGQVDPTLTFTHSALLGSDTDSIFTGSLIRTAGESVGTYLIQLGTLDAGPNYVIHFTGNTFTIQAVPTSPNSGLPNTVIRNAQNAEMSGDDSFWNTQGVEDQMAAHHAASDGFQSARELDHEFDRHEVPLIRASPELLHAMGEHTLSI